MADVPLPGSGGSLPVVVKTSGDPPFEQIRAQIATLIGSGRLLPGARLPTVRALAADLGIAVNTVARAYKELETEGLVVTRRRAGTTVASGEHTAEVALAALARSFATAARSAGLDEGSALDLVRTALRASG